MKRNFGAPIYEWDLPVDNFKLQVRAHKTYTGYGWCLYVFFYDDFFYFDKLDVLIEELDWNGGCTFSKSCIESSVAKYYPRNIYRQYYRQYREREYLRIGCDYQHSFNNLSHCNPVDGIPDAILQDVEVLIQQIRALVGGA
jgi:hypothetical protein